MRPTSDDQVEVHRHHAGARTRSGRCRLGGSRGAAPRPESVPPFWLSLAVGVGPALLPRSADPARDRDIEVILDHQVSDTTLRTRRDEWIDAGAFDRGVIGLDLNDVAPDGSLHKAAYGGEGIGPNSTDRARLGWK